MSDLMIERSIVEFILRTAIEHGLEFSVWDGEDWALERSNNVQDAMAAIQSTGGDVITLYKDGRIFGKYWLVYGNGEDVISDSTSSDEFDKFDSIVDDFLNNGQFEGTL